MAWPLNQTRRRVSRNESWREAGDGVRGERCASMLKPRAFLNVSSNARFIVHDHPIQCLLNQANRQRVPPIPALIRQSPFSPDLVEDWRTAGERRRLRSSGVMSYAAPVHKAV